MARKKTSTQKAPRKATRTQKATRKRREQKKPTLSGGRHYEGPAAWLIPELEETYAPITLKAEAEGRRARPAARAAAGAGKRKAAKTRAEARVSAALPEAALAPVPRTYWQVRFKKFHERRVERAKKATAARAAAGVTGRSMPSIPGLNNWTPIGPSVTARGQTSNRAPVTGRVCGIAVAPGGLRMYVATANGGVWRSDDAGVSWRSTMDSFDQNPTNFASTSLACGAIAINSANPDRIYVGTGEGDTDALFASRIVNALPSYRGIGPIRSDDGGGTWVLEPSTPSLAGFAFFQIAVDPADPDHCVAATTNGLYRRVPVAGGGFEWTRVRTGSHSSVVVSRASGVTTWFAATFGGSVVSSTNGSSWSALGTSFPTGIGRIALGVQPDNPNVLYAFIADAGGSLSGVRRLDGVSGAWKTVTGVPAVLPGSQGDYDLCIAVDPNDANRIYLGGDYFNANPYPGSIWRCIVSPSGTSYSMTGTAIGGNAHADVHSLVHTPGNSNQLWTGTDGGLYLNPNPTGAGQFEHRNTGLATLCTNFMAQNLIEPAVLFVGLQDNGTAKCTGEAVWRHVLFADGGYCVVNWDDPFRVLLFANGSVYRATDGGLDYGSWTAVTPSGAQWVVMAAPLVGAPLNTSAPAEANVVAYGAGAGASTIVYFSEDFGTTWPVGARVTLPSGSGRVFSMVFASATRLYAGTTNGRVFRVDKSGAAWTATRIDNATGGSMPLAALITDITVDRSDATLNTIFISIGGTGDARHVWRFNGASWQARSGTAASGTDLLDVEHNAIVHDPVTNRVFVGADIGVWESADDGVNWAPLSNGLPDAPVFDLQLHPTARLLRASLHGRGVWEWKIDPPILADVELYIRDTMLDTGRGVNTDGRNDPSIFPTGPVFHYLGPNIKVDVPTPAGYQTPTTQIDFLTFNEVIQDGSNGVATNSPPPTVQNRFYAEIHNRGRVDATNVQVMAAITNAATGLGLPAGFTANVQAGTALPGPKWITLGVRTVSVIRAGFPQVVHFDLPSTVLPMPASLPGNSHWCSVVFVHAAQDPFSSTISNVDALTLADRKVGQKNLHLVEFVGTPPPPGTGIGTWAMLIVSGIHFRERRAIHLLIDARRFPGDLYFAVPPALYPATAGQMKNLRAGSAAVVKRWIDGYGPVAERLYFEAKYAEHQYQLLVESMRLVARQKPLVQKGGTVAELRDLPLGPRDEIPVFMRIDPPANARAGTTYDFDVMQFDAQSNKRLGGSRYRVVINRKVGQG
jgi:hypothetical protein